METKVGTSIILINENDEILIGKRQGSHGAGMYSIPGGHLEYNERYEECCDRELMEEIGVNFPGEYYQVGFSEDFFEGGKHYITLYFVVRDIDSEIKIINMEPDKCEEWKWIHYSKIPENMFCDSYNQIQSLFFPF